MPVAVTDGTSFPAKATLSIYAPQMYPVLGSLATVKDVATRISEVIQRDSVGSQTLTDPISGGLAGLISSEFGMSTDLLASEVELAGN